LEIKIDTLNFHYIAHGFDLTLHL